MDAERVNYLNLGLIGLSALAAFYLPFPLFLISYAALGPLHYLTEISWLHQRGYFTRRRRDYWLLGALALGIVAIGIGLEKVLDAMQIQAVSRSAGFLILFVGFGGALVLALEKEIPRRALAFTLLGATGLFLQGKAPWQLAFTVFLPTLVHVFLFTGAFMLFGALKARSVSGLAQCALFALAPVGLWFFNDYGTGWVLSDPVVEGYFPPDGKGGMASLYIATIKTFGLGEVKTREDLFYSSYGILVARFIAFAYTYHYLNWFSKTSLIGWHRVSRLRLAAVGLFWIVSMALYLRDFRLGLQVLYTLSFLHVFLEFPLNHVSFVGIGRELGEIVRTRRFAPAARSVP